MTTTGVSRSEGSASCSARKSHPSIIGIMTSRTITSTRRPERNLCKASRPLLADTTEKPSPSRKSDRPSRIAKSSSTRSTFAPPTDGGSLTVARAALDSVTSAPAQLGNRVEHIGAPPRSGDVRLGTTPEFVAEDESGLAPPQGTASRKSHNLPPRPAVSAGRRGTWYIEDERASLSGHVAHLDGPIVSFRGLQGDAQPEAVAASILAALYEGGE